MHINAVQDQVETKTFGSTLVVHTIVINRLCKRNTFSTCSYLRDAVVERGCDGLDHWLGGSVICSMVAKNARRYRFAYCSLLRHQPREK